MIRADFSAVEAFVRVADTGSFRAAAGVLGCPVSTVSVQVARLEARLGTRLVARTTRRVSLTDEGRTYHAAARAALDALCGAEQALAGRGATPRGHLRIAAPAAWGESVLGRVLGRFLAAHPEVDVEVVLGDATADPVRDGFDLAIQRDPAASSSLVARKLGTPMRQRVLAAPSYLRAHGTPRHPRDLAGHTCLVTGARHAHTRWQLGRHALVHRHTTANSAQVCRDLAVAGRGVALLPDYLGAPALAERTLVEVLAGHPPPPDQLFAVYAKSAFVPPRVREFIAALRAHLEVWPNCLLARKSPP